MKLGRLATGIVLAAFLPAAAQVPDSNAPPLHPLMTQAAPVTVAPAPSASPTPKLADPFSDPLIQQVQARHERAALGDVKETKALTADLEKWTREQPDNHLLQAYLGSAYTLCSRDAWPGPGKLKYLQEGGQTLDAAVVAAPDNPAVRLVRAIDYFKLPGIFGKHPAARADFALLVRQVEGQAPMPYVLKKTTIQAIYYFAGQSAPHTAEARALWQRGLDLDPTTDLAVKIRAELDKIARN